MIDIKTISDISNAARGRRLEIGLSQNDLARRAGMSRKWVYEFEAGKPGAELRNVLALLDALGMAFTLGVLPASSSTSDAVDLDALLDEYMQD